MAGCDEGVTQGVLVSNTRSRRARAASTWFLSRVPSPMGPPEEPAPLRP